MSNITIPNTLSDGNTILASEHNQNYTAITDVVNGNIDNDNIAAGAAIAASKLAIANILTTASTISIGVGTTGDTNPRIALDTDGHLVLGSGSAAGDVRLTRESAGVAAIRNAANNAYEDLKCDGITASGTVACDTITPTNPVSVTTGGTGLTDSDLSGKAYQKIGVNSSGDGYAVVDIAPSTLTVATGSITPTKPMHIISPEGGSPDELTTIVTSNVADGQQLTLLSDGSGNAITVENSGNIHTCDGNDFVIEDGGYIRLVRNGTDWYEIGRLSAASGEQANSTEGTPVINTLVTWAHGLGVAPSDFWVRLRNATADIGYTANQYTVLRNTYTYSTGGCIVVYADATNVYFRNIATYGIDLPRPNTAEWDSTTESKWRYQVFARA